MKFVLDFENAEVIGDLDTKIRLCVLVNTYNHEKYIEECLLSIIKQETVFPFKIIVHDDNSTDGTRNILLEYQRKYPELILLILESENQWQFGNSNLAMLLSWIDSDFVALCEGDDFWNSKDKLSIQEKILTENPGISLSYHAVEILNEIADDKYAKKIMKVLGVQRSNFPELELGRSNFVMTGSVMFRNHLVHNSFFAGIHSIFPVDWLLFAALAEGGHIDFLNEKLSTYRIHAASMWSSKIQEDREKRLEQVHWYMAGALKGDVGAQARKYLSSQSKFNNLWIFKFLRRFRLLRKLFWLLKRALKH